MDPQLRVKLFKYHLSIYQMHFLVETLISYLGTAYHSVKPYRLRYPSGYGSREEFYFYYVAR